MGVNDDLNDVFDVLFVLWRRKWLFLTILAFFVVAGGIYCAVARKIYRSDVVLAPRGDSGLSGNLAQLGGLASLAGIQLSGTGDSTTPLAVLKSQDLARSFIQDRKLIDPILAEYHRSSEPGDIRDAVRYFDEHIRTVVEDKRTGMTILSVTWVDPKLSAQWANELVGVVNARLRDESIAESERNIAYLREQLRESSQPALQTSVTTVLQREMQSLILARGNEEFAFKIIDRAVVPKKSASPRKVIIMAISGVLGSLIATALVLLVHSLARRQAQSGQLRS